MDHVKLGTVGRVVQEHEAKRAKSLEQLGKSRKVAIKAVEKATSLLQPKAAFQAEEVAKGQIQVDRAARRLRGQTRELEDLGEGWADAFGEMSAGLVHLGDVRNWAETIELQLRSVRAELDHSQACMKSWEELREELQS